MFMDYLTMTPKQLYQSDSAEFQRIAEEAGTSFDNFRNIALYGGAVGRFLADRLSKASKGKMQPMEILYQSEIEQQAA